MSDRKHRKTNWLERLAGRKPLTSKGKGKTEQREGHASSPPLSPSSSSAPVQHYGHSNAVSATPSSPQPLSQHAYQMVPHPVATSSTPSFRRSMPPIVHATNPHSPIYSPRVSSPVFSKPRSPPQQSPPHSPTWQRPPYVSTSLPPREFLQDPRLLQNPHFNVPIHGNVKCENCVEVHAAVFSDSYARLTADPSENQKALDLAELRKYRVPNGMINTEPGFGNCQTVSICRVLNIRTEDLFRQPEIAEAEAAWRKRISEKEPSTAFPTMYHVDRVDLQQILSKAKNRLGEDRDLHLNQQVWTLGMLSEIQEPFREYFTRCAEAMRAQRGAGTRLCFAYPNTEKGRPGHALNFEKCGEDNNLHCQCGLWHWCDYQLAYTNVVMQDERTIQYLQELVQAYKATEKEEPDYEDYNRGYVRLYGFDNISRARDTFEWWDRTRAWRNPPKELAEGHARVMSFQEEDGTRST